MLTALLLALLAAPVFAAKPLPPSPVSYVYNEGVVSPAAEQRLSEELRAFELNTGHQFVVALFQSLDQESLEDYVNRLFREWKIGSKKQNDGLLFSVFLKDRRWRVEVGYGLEPVLTDLEAAEFVRSYAVPHFQADDYDAGVEAAVQSLIAKISGAAESSPVSRDEELQLLRIAQIKLALRAIGWCLLGFFFVFWYTYEHGTDWGFRSGATHTLVEHDGWNFAQNRRYPIRFFLIIALYVFLLTKLFFELLRLLMYSAMFSRGGYYGGGSYGGGGFSGGGGSSGGGGASGGW